MRYVWALSILLLIMPLATPAQKSKKSPAKMDTMTGCVDEKTDVTTSV